MVAPPETMLVILPVVIFAVVFVMVRMCPVNHSAPEDPKVSDPESTGNNDWETTVVLLI